MLRLCYRRAGIRYGLSAVTLAFLLAIVSNAQTPTPQKDPVKTPTTKEKIERWFEIEQLSVGTRYHFIENANRTKAANNDQYQFIGKFRFKFDKKGNYSIAANLATGPSFTTFWNATGWGTGTYQKDLNLRQLYFDAKPNEAVEVQFGGTYVNYGDLTEAITYDNDSYITGARIQLRAPKKLYFDEISATTANIGDINRPDIFHRLRHLDIQNYHQFLVRKQFSKDIGVTADYTFQSGIDTLHQAIKIKIPPKHFIDTFLFENYERLDPGRSYGFNIFGEKKLNKMFTASGGFADIHIASINNDRFPPGKRIYLTGIAKLSPEFSLTMQFTQGVGPILPTLPRTRVDIILNYNILETLKRTKLF
jgi:hypothetical protein